MTSAFPEQDWVVPLHENLILSGNPRDQLDYISEFVRKVNTVFGEVGEGIYGQQNEFAPVAQGSSTAGTGTYEVQVGHWSRFGRMLWFQVNLQWDDSNHTGTGDLQITGLPYSAYNLTNSKVLVPLYNAESGSEFVGIGFIDPGDNKISVIKNGATTQQINGADYDLQITGTYRVL